MFKRVLWLGIGAAAGATGTVWAQQKVRRRLDDLGPDHVVITAGTTARRVGRTVRDAVSEGRTAMRDREDELRLQRDVRPAKGAVHRGASSREPTRPTRPTSW